MRTNLFIIYFREPFSNFVNHYLKRCWPFRSFFYCKFSLRALRWHFFSKETKLIFFHFVDKVVTILFCWFNALLWMHTFIKVGLKSFTLRECIIQKFHFQIMMWFSHYAYNLFWMLNLSTEYFPEFDRKVSLQGNIFNWEVETALKTWLINKFFELLRKT